LPGLPNDYRITDANITREDPWRQDQSAALFFRGVADGRRIHANIANRQEDQPFTPGPGPMAAGPGGLLPGRHWPASPRSRRSLRW
jgi:hypothetical protein